MSSNNTSYQLAILILSANTHNEYTGYHTKPSDEAPVLEFWGMWKAPSLPLLPGSLWFEVAVPVMFPSMCQIGVFNHLLYLKSFNFVQTTD